MFTSEQDKELRNLPHITNAFRLHLIARLLRYHFSEWGAAKGAVWEGYISSPYSDGAVTELIYNIADNNEWVVAKIVRMCDEWEAINHVQTK